MPLPLAAIHPTVAAVVAATCPACKSAPQAAEAGWVRQEERPERGGRPTERFAGPAHAEEMDDAKASTIAARAVAANVTDKELTAMEYLQYQIPDDLAGHPRALDVSKTRGFCG